MGRSLQIGAWLAALLAVLGASLTSYAQTATYTAEYFNNTSLSGNPAFTRLESSINQDWGVGSPDASVRFDNFSARWTADVFFNAGEYRFSGNADDSFRFFLDGDLLIDGFDNTGVVPGQTLTVDRTLEESRTYNIRVEYREATENAFINFGWQALVVIEAGNFTTIGSFDETWQAQYYNNVDLSGDPVVVQNVISPTIFFGVNSPTGGINADNFSIRFTNTRVYTEGQYRLTVRPDDGVRVIINGNTIIDQFGGPPDQVYTADVSLPAGSSTVVIEYREFNGPAFLSYSLVPAALAPVNRPQPFEGGAFVEINVPRLNVRNGPAVTFERFAQVTLGQRFAVIGRNVGSSWWFIDLGDGREGWVSGAFVLPVNVAGVNLVNTVNFTPPVVVDQGGGAVPTNLIPPPVPPPSPVLSPTGQTTRTQVNANLRNGPSTGSGRLTTIPANTELPVIARSVNGGWWLVEYLGVQGWVSGSLLVFPATTNFDAIPVT